MPSSEKQKLVKKEADAPLRKGETRGCTDCLCLLFFIAFWIGMIIVAVFAFQHGNVHLIVNGYDSYGNICGYKNSKLTGMSKSGRDTRDTPFVFFFDIRQPLRSHEICVSKCPDKDLVTNEDLAQFAKDTGSKLCDYDIEVDDYPSTRNSLEANGCPVLIPSSQPILNRCVPNNASILSEIFVNDLIDFLNASEFISKALIDLYIARWAILGLCLVSMVVAFLMIIFLHCVAQVIVWVIYFLSIVGTIAGTIALWVTWYMKKQAYDTKPDQYKLEMEADNVKTFLIFSICATVFTVILLLVILVMRKRIAFAIELFHQAGKALSAMPLLLFLPFWTFLALMALFVYVTAVFLVIASTGKGRMAMDTSQNMSFFTFDPPQQIRHLWWYHLIGFLWTMEFILACHQFVIAACVVTWYFDREKKSFSSPILNSIWILVRNHLGSMVFGSFIITLVKVPRAILLYIQAKLKGRESEIVTFVLRCLSCCLWCLENILKFINEHAYIVIAIEGKSFCPAARKALITLISNALRVAAINCVGDFILFLGKLLVVCITALIGVAALGFNDDLHYYAIPVFLACIFAFLVASSYFNVYAMAVDTLLLCFCEDMKINDGSAEKPYFMDPDLMTFVTSSSDKLDGRTRRRRRLPEGEDAADSPAGVKPEEMENLQSAPPAGKSEEPSGEATEQQPINVVDETDGKGE